MRLIVTIWKRRILKCSLIEMEKLNWCAVANKWNKIQIAFIFRVFQNESQMNIQRWLWLNINEYNTNSIPTRLDLFAMETIAKWIMDEKRK